MQAIAISTRGAIAIYRAEYGRRDWRRTAMFSVQAGDSHSDVSAVTLALTAAGIQVHRVRSDELMTTFLPRATMLEILDLPEPVVT